MVGIEMLNPRKPEPIPPHHVSPPTIAVAENADKNNKTPTESSLSGLDAFAITFPKQ